VPPGKFGFDLDQHGARSAPGIEKGFFAMTAPIPIALLPESTTTVKSR
jgi:hypothetical protein